MLGYKNLAFEGLEAIYDQLFSSIVIFVKYRKVSTRTIFAI